MSEGVTSPVYVLTDTPGIYGDELNLDEVLPIFIKDIKTLLEKLKDAPMAGLVLELAKVMQGTARERDRLFNYAGSFPVLRTKINPRHGFVTYLDPKETFLNNLKEFAGKRLRYYERIPCNLACSFSKEDDPSLAAGKIATVLDISPGGCLINTVSFFEKEQFIHLRIPQLTNARPIYCSVRWTRSDDDPAKCGVGVMFVDLTDDQFDEIRDMKNS